MRILYTTTIGSTMRFFKDLSIALIKDGHTIDIATNENDGETPVPSYYREWGCRVIQIPWSRSPLASQNLRAIRQLRSLTKKETYDIVHCHTPVAALCTRLACKNLRNKGMHIIYTAHGFHFYKGAPIKNWLLFYPAEKAASYWTDALITINTEDYEMALKRMKAKRIIYVPGVGVDQSKIGDEKGNQRIRGEFGIHKDSFVLLSVGELNENKNQRKVIEAVQGLDIQYIIVGSGSTKPALQKTINKKNLEEHVFLAGQRQDVEDFYAAADGYILPSYREGLNVSLMEAMTNGLPCLCGNIRGNRDLIDEEGGYLFDPGSVSCIRDAIVKLMSADREKMGKHNKEKIESFGIKKVNEQMMNLYNGIISTTQR